MLSPRGVLVGQMFQVRNVALQHVIESDQGASLAGGQVAKVETCKLPFEPAPMVISTQGNNSLLQPV